jgi:hypothetical protein
LVEALRRCVPAGFVVRQEQPLTTESSEPEPDLSVVRGSADDYRVPLPRGSKLRPEYRL